MSSRVKVILEGQNFGVDYIVVPHTLAIPWFTGYGTPVRVQEIAEYYGRVYPDLYFVRS